jgi:hypothetical protein
MKLDKRRLQRRYNLSQSQPPENLLHHQHAFWDTKRYTLFAGDTRYTTSSYRAVGTKVLINPIEIMYAVKAELIITATFAGTPDAFCVNFNIGSTAYEECSREVLTHGNYTIDLEDTIKAFFKTFREENAYIEVKVSNIAVPLDLFGAQLVFTTYMEDTYGDYANVTQPMLTDDSDINKSYVKALDEESKTFEYLSGIKPM